MPVLSNYSPTKRLRRFAKADEGQALVLAGLGMVVLLMMAGLGVDVGYLHYQRQQMQKAADAGAMAGASALIYGGNYTAAGQNDSSANGFTNNVNGVTVTVNSPPQTPGDPFLNKAGYVEVIVAQARPTFFMRVGGFNTVNVSARAVGSALANSSGCIFALDPSSSKTLLIDGGVSIGSTCAIYVESSSDDALHKNGSSGSVTASYIGVVGGSQINGGFQYDCSSNGPGAPCPATGIATFLDPFLNVPAPPVASGCQNPVGNNYPAGTYCHGISISGSGPYTFGPGLITVEGAMNVIGSPRLTGTGVQFYLTCSTPGSCAGNGGTYGGISIGGNATVQLTAPTSSPKQGSCSSKTVRCPSMLPRVPSMAQVETASAGLSTFPLPTCNTQGRQVSLTPQSWSRGS